MKKFNLLINGSFKKFNFNDTVDESVYSTCNDNLLKYSVALILEGKPSDSITSTSISVGASTNIYLFPLSSTNYAFNTGDILHTHDNVATFIITNHIIENKFTVKLLAVSSGVSYTLFNSTMAILYNKEYEKYMYNNNKLKTLLKAQKTEYTSYINNNNDFVLYLLEKLAITSTDSTVNIAFNFSNQSSNSILFSNIINKFYLNIQLFDYIDFKYIYMLDIFNKESSENEYLVSTNLVSGVLKSLSTKIIPHFSQQLILNNTYNFTTSTINNYTKFKKTYNNNKSLVLIQLTLKDKSTIYNPIDTIESDYMYLIQ